MKLKQTIKALIFFVISGSAIYASLAFAEVTNVGDIADMIVKSFESIGKLMIATAYISGIGFTIASVFKFKQHRDNPTQIPIGAPIALLAIGVVLIFMPGIIAPVGQTLFGSNNMNAMSGGFTGTGASAIPGGKLQ